MKSPIDAESIRSRVDGRYTFDLSELSSEALKEADCWDRVLVVPNDTDLRFSYLADSLVQMTNSAANSSSKDTDLRYAVGQICQALSYVANSASWREGTLLDFDLEELRGKLHRLGARGGSDAQG